MRGFGEANILWSSASLRVKIGAGIVCSWTTQSWWNRSLTLTAFVTLYVPSPDLLKFELDAYLVI